MNQEPIKSLHIENFRAFKSFDLPNVRKINLIGGMNNAGKSSLLEAVHVLSSAGTKLHTLAHHRTRTADNLISPANQDTDEPTAGTTWLTSMWNGFPAFNERQSERIVVADQDVSVDIQRGLHIQNGSDTSFDFLRGDEMFAPKSEPAYKVELHTKNSKKPAFFSLPVAAKQPEILHPDPYMRERVYYRSPMRLFMDLAVYWDRIALSPAQGQVLDLLRIFEPNLEQLAFKMERSGVRSPYYSIKGDPKPYPLALMGDGMNQVLAIGLMLGVMQDGVVLLDEVENGLHYTAQKELWKAILRYTKDKNLQVFATTHSNDTLYALARAAVAEGMEEDCHFIRLERTDDGIKPYTASVNAMLSSKDPDIELR